MSCYCCLYVFSALFVVFLAILFHKKRECNRRLTSKHILITGGSKGIGRSIAFECFQRGANLTLFARNERDLNDTKEAILASVVDNTQQKIVCIAVDVSRDFESVVGAVKEAESRLGPIDMLFNCVGNAVSHRFDETPVADFKQMIDVNYLSAVYCTKAVLPQMKAHKEGTIVFFSSIAGLVGIYGFSAYSASKFALTGYAQALLMEVKPFNIGITVSFPPDTDTPGFAKEQESKPLETQLISAGGGLFSPEKVARQTVKDALSGKFASTVGLEGFVVKTAASGMFPVDSLFDVTLQTLTMGLFRVFSSYFLWSCDRIVSSKK